MQLFVQFSRCFVGIAFLTIMVLVESVIHRVNSIFCSSSDKNKAPLVGPV